MPNFNKMPRHLASEIKMPPIASPSNIKSEVGSVQFEEQLSMHIQSSKALFPLTDVQEKIRNANLMSDGTTKLIDRTDTTEVFEKYDNEIYPRSMKEFDYPEQVDKELKDNHSIMYQF